VSLFVDTSVWYAAADSSDRSNGRARTILSGGDRLVTSDHVLLETWLLLRHRISREAAERFWEAIGGGAATLEMVTGSDLQAAWAAGRDFPDQDFSLTDRTSFAVMERLGVHRAASFDADFSVYRFGRDRRRAFEVLG
jgi:predicted nucleic acid-binding protein